MVFVDFSCKSVPGRESGPSPSAIGNLAPRVAGWEARGHQSGVFQVCHVPGAPCLSGIPILPTLKVSGELSHSVMERSPGKTSNMLRRSSRESSRGLSEGSVAEDSLVHLRCQMACTEDWHSAGQKGRCLPAGKSCSLETERPGASSAHP